MLPISSPHNPRIKEALRLRERRGRDKQQRILIDGTREIARAVGAGVELLETFVCTELCNSATEQRLIEEISSRGGALYSVPLAVFERLAYGERAEGLVAIARPPQRSLADIVVPPQALVAVLEGIEKPGNVGAVLRSADAAGVSAVIVTGGGTDLFNPNCIRASLGTVFTLPVCAASTAETLAWLRRKSLAIYAARVDAAVDYRQVEVAERAAIVLGSEARGLSRDWQAADVRAIKLPMLGVADSLNVSVTAAVLFYEALRQRGIASTRVGSPHESPTG